MKTPEEITRWCDMMLNRHPNIEDTNFFNSIKDYMKEQRPQGMWKHIVEEDNDVECPFCGFQEDGIYYNFCPGCGAKMQIERCR